MMSNNPFQSPGNFSPRIAAEVAAAYKHNVECGLMPSTDLADSVSVQSLGNLIKNATVEARDTNKPGLCEFSMLENPEMIKVFESSFKASEALFDLIDIAIPTPEECIVAGIDIKELAFCYSKMETDGLKPELVLSPNLDASTWCELYEELVNEPAVVRYDRLKGEGGLRLQPLVTENWDELTEPDSTVLAITSDNVENPYSWTLRLIPGTVDPTEVGVGHSHNQAVHPTIGEYLTLQATLIRANLEPLDSDTTYTWLNGSYISHFTNTAIAPYGNWGPITGIVNINCSGAGHISEGKGTRYPVSVEL